MCMHLVPLVAALIQKRQLEQRPHVRPLARQGDEQRHIRRIVLRALPVRVEVNRPRVVPDSEILGSDVLADAEVFGEGVSGDLEVVGSVDGVGDGGGGGEGGCEHRPRRRPAVGAALTQTHAHAHLNLQALCFRPPPLPTKDQEKSNLSENPETENLEFRQKDRFP